jgi:deazaflavin-dependent oxidoreductase (nitroreductase family)
MDQEQGSAGRMTYPARGTLERLYYKLPLLLWRMGLGGYLCHPKRGGNRMLVLTTRGRKSGQPRHTMLSHVPVGEADYVCSGWGPRSDWVRNITNDPLVTVQPFKLCYGAQARAVTGLDEFRRFAEEIFQAGGDSHFKPWLESMGIEYTLEDMIAKRGHLLVYTFDRIDRKGPEPLSTDLVWLWGVPILLILLILLLR